MSSAWLRFSRSLVDIFTKSVSLACLWFSSNSYISSSSSSEGSSVKTGTGVSCEWVTGRIAKSRFGWFNFCRVFLLCPEAFVRQKWQSFTWFFSYHHTIRMPNDSCFLVPFVHWHRFLTHSLHTLCGAHDLSWSPILSLK